MPMKDFKTLPAAQAFVRKLEKGGNYSGGIGAEEIKRMGSPKRTRYTVRWQGSDEDRLDIAADFMPGDEL